MWFSSLSLQVNEWKHDWPNVQPVACGILFIYFFMFICLNTFESFAHKNQTGCWLFMDLFVFERVSGQKKVH